MKEKKIKKIENVISNFVEKYSINSILLTISGGQDSIYLVKILENLKKEVYKKK